MAKTELTLPFIARVTASASLNATPTAARSLSGDGHPGRFGLSTAYAAGSGPLGQVVVGDDHVDPRGLQPVDRRVRARPAIARDDEARPACLRRAHARVAEVVAVRQPPRNERHDGAAERAERPHHERRRADAVDVVVAVDENGLLVPYGARDALDRAIEVGELCRLVEMIEARPEVAPWRDPARRIREWRGGDRPRAAGGALP